MWRLPRAPGPHCACCEAVLAPSSHKAHPASFTYWKLTANNCPRFRAMTELPKPG